MTLVSLSSPIHWPGNLGSTGGSPGVGASSSLDAAGEYVSYVFVARENMVVSHVGFRAGTATGSPTAEVRIETIDPATGLPSGTLWATDTNLTTGTLTANTWTLQALTASATISKGSAFCVKIAYASGTNFTIGIFNNSNFFYQSNFPYIVNNTGTPTKTVMNNFAALLALGSSSTAFYQVYGSFPYTSTTGGAFNNTNSAKRGMRFTLPMDCRIVGIRWYNSSSVGDYNAVIFDDAGAELSSSSTAFEGDLTAASANAAMTVFLDNPVIGSAGSTYRAVIEPSSATNVTVNAYVLPSADYLGACPAGAMAHYTTFATATWTDSATSTIPMMDILIDQIDDGAGSGGGMLRHPGMSGGMSA